jgi:aminopeptidase
MNAWAFESLQYTNEIGTNLTIRLPEGHIWAGGAEETQNGRIFVANLPTEEIYTLPHREGVDGVVVATKPLVFHGNLITGIRLRFEAGKVVS